MQNDEFVRWRQAPNRASQQGWGHLPPLGRTPPRRRTTRRRGSSFTLKSTDLSMRRISTRRAISRSKVKGIFFVFRRAPGNHVIRGCFSEMSTVLRIDISPRATDLLSDKQLLNWKQFPYWISCHFLIATQTTANAALIVAAKEGKQLPRWMVRPVSVVAKIVRDSFAFCIDCPPLIFETMFTRLPESPRNTLTSF